MAPPSHLLRALLVLTMTVAAVAQAHDGRDDSGYKPANWKAVRDPLPSPPAKPVAALNTTGCQTVLQVRHVHLIARATSGEAVVNATCARRQRGSCLERFHT